MHKHQFFEEQLIHYKESTMNCIFCKKEASSSKSIEHIVPESLGNKNHVLPKGIVCDKCNNYFALKIEKPVLEMDFFRDLRHRNKIKSKKGIIPKGKAFIPIVEKDAEVSIEGNEIVIFLDGTSCDMVKEGKIKNVLIPIIKDIPKDNVFVSRFLIKVGFEMLANRILIENKENQNLFVSESGFDIIRNYTRYNHKRENWVYNVRRIYDEDEKFFSKNGKSVDMLFESDFLVTADKELYFIIAIKGIEFVINMAGSSIEGYLFWLKENNISPLYREGRNEKSKLIPNFLRKMI